MRVNIKISDELGDKLEFWSSKFGMSKSGFIAYALGNHIHDLEYKEDIVQSVSDRIKSTDFLGGKENHEPTVQPSDENLYY